MKYLLMTAALMTGISSAMAESTIKVPDNFKETMVQTQAALERCIGATAAKLPNETCGAVSNILTQLSNLPLTPVVPAPAPAPAPAPSPTP